MWISVKEKHPIRDTYILVTDGKKVKPFYTSDLHVFFTEGQDPKEYITYEDGTRIKVSEIIGWMEFPKPMPQCAVCCYKEQEWQQFIDSHKRREYE